MLGRAGPWDTEHWKNQASRAVDEKNKMCLPKPGGEPQIPDRKPLVPRCVIRTFYGQSSIPCQLAKEDHPRTQICWQRWNGVLITGRDLGEFLQSHG